MALSPHETGGAHHRREERHRRIAGCAVFKGIAVQADLSRSLGNPARTVTFCHSERSRGTRAAKVSVTSRDPSTPLRSAQDDQL